MNKKIIFFTLSFLFCFFLTACFEQPEEPLHYNDVSDFYGAWQLEASYQNNGYKEYVKLLPNGTYVYLKVYNPEFYPKDMFDLKESNWSVELNTLKIDIISYYIEYSTAKEIFLSNSMHGTVKLKKISDEVFDLYINGGDDYKDKSIDDDGDVLNYKSISDFYGDWIVTYLPGSFGIDPNKTTYLTIHEDGTLKYKVVDKSLNITNEYEDKWKIEKNVFWWGIMNYDINYSKNNTISISRSATNLLLVRP